MFKNIVDSNKMTCYELSKISGISYTTINDLYNGKRSIDDCLLKNVKKLATIFNMTLEEFCIKSVEREKIPTNLYQCFWDTNPKALDVVKNKTYIITRLLDQGGYEGYLFLKRAYTYEDMKEVGKNSRNFSPKIASFMQNVFNIKKEEMNYYIKNIQDWRI